jgi:hypothetical protein
VNSWHGQLKRYELFATHRLKDRPNQEPRRRGASTPTNDSWVWYHYLWCHAAKGAMQWHTYKVATAFGAVCSYDFFFGFFAAAIGLAK